MTTDSRNSRAYTFDLLIMAVWFALATGLLEGLTRTAVQGLGRATWDQLLAGTSVKIIWVAPLLYLAFFGLGGITHAAVHAIAPRLPMRKIGFILFSTVGFLDVLSGSGRLSVWGVFMMSLGLAVALGRWYVRHEDAVTRFMRRTVLPLAGCVLFAFIAIEVGIRVSESRTIAALPPAAPGAPNVLIVIVDTLRADHLSQYGYARKTSPNLERIGQESVTFEHALAPAPWTLPSHASILTGLYPTEHRAEKFPLSPHPLLLPEAMQGLGYRTGAFSANTLFFSRAQGFGRGFIHFTDYFQTLPDAVWRTTLGQYFFKYVLARFGYSLEIVGRQFADQINDSAMAWIERNRERPFFVVLNYMDTHIPYEPRAPYATAYTNNAGAAGRFNAAVEAFPMNKVPADVVPGGVATYDGAVLYVDAQIGRLMGDLEKLGLAQNTLVIVTSDHGEMLGEHDFFGHAHSVWAPELYVPLLFRWPGKIPAGKRVQAQVSLASLPATVMSLLGQEAQPFPGPSLAPLWTEASEPADWPYPWAELAACPERKRPQIPCYNGALKAIASTDWFFIYQEKQPPQLFDRKKDAAQEHNLAGTPEAQPVVQDFLSRIQSKQMRAGQIKNNLLANRMNSSNSQE